MVTIDNLRDRFEERSIKTARTASPHEGNIKMVTGYKLTREQHPVNPLIANYGLSGKGGRIGIILESTAAVHASMLESLYVHDYGNVKYDERWRHMYHRSQRNFEFQNAQNVVVPQSLWSYPCHYCGFILPEQFIEVDHRQPKAHPGVAVLKCLHTLGGDYTVNPAKGVKGRNLAAIANAAVPPTGAIANAAVAHAAVIAQLPRIATKGRNWNIDWQQANLQLDPNKLQRYTITPEGSTFLTLCAMLWGDVAAVKVCVNSIINLVPACRQCNGPKSDITHAT